MRVVHQKIDIGDADLRELPARIVRIRGDDLVLPPVPLLVDVAHDGKEKIVEIGKMLVGRGAGHVAGLGHAAQRKPPHAVRFDLPDTRENQLFLQMSAVTLHAVSIARTPAHGKDGAPAFCGARRAQRVAQLWRDSRQAVQAPGSRQAVAHTAKRRQSGPASGQPPHGQRNFVLEA